MQVLREPTPIGFHVTLRLEDDRPLATSATALRVIVRVVLAQGEGRGLLAFGAADDHLHAELATDRASAGTFALYVETALRARLALRARFEKARIRPLRDQRHAYNTFHYVPRQDVRHGLGHDPMRGTSLPDLLGLRVLGSSLPSRVRASLPRVRRAELATTFPPIFEDHTTAIAVEVLADAAAAAFALPNLRSRSADVARARHAATHVVPGVSSRSLGECLGIGLRAVRSLRATPADPFVVRAIRGQALLRMAASSRAMNPEGEEAR